MTQTLTTQMDLITAQLLRGEISQEEALKQQRELLGAPEQPTTETPATNLSTETKVEAAVAKYAAKKDAARERLTAIAEQAASVEADRQRLTGAISAAESKSRILSGSPTAYRSEKADLIARGLLGEKVDLTAIQTPAEDFSDNISAQDLALGIKALRTQLQEVERRKVGVEAERRKASHEFFEAHARAHGIRFAQLASQLADAYCAIQAAHRASLSAGNTFSTLAPASLSDMVIHSPLPDDVMRECGVTRREWSGVILEQTNLVNVAANQMFAEMGGAA